jgi:hypothetical protein
VPYAIGLVVLVLALWLALSAVLVATPLVVVAAIFVLRSVPISPPALPDPEKYDQPETRERLKGLASNLVPLMLRKSEITEEAKTLGIGITNAGRYDQRKKAGRSFNEEIDALESRSRRLVEEFSDLRVRVASTLPNYRAEFDDWLTRRTTLLAAIISAKVYPLGFCGGLLLSPLLGEPISEIMIGHWPAWLASGAFVACVCAIGAFLVVRITKRNELAASLDDDQDRRWRALVHFWNSDDDTALQQHVAAVPGSSKEQNLSADSDRSPGRWEDALGVGADASIDEIKTAWKTRMKEYHPDRVQTLGPKLRELAEAETKRLNEAYEAALRSRGVA